MAEAQFALGEKDSVLLSLLSAADARGATVGGNFQRQRHQGAGSVELCRDCAAEAPGSGSHGLLATIGATSPFVGLFGTVWGHP